MIVFIPTSRIDVQKRNTSGSGNTLSPAWISGAKLHAATASQNSSSQAPNTTLLLIKEEKKKPSLRFFGHRHFLSSHLQVLSPSFNLIGPITIMAGLPDMSEFTSVFRARININDKRKANKRNRQALSCLPCRYKKLKCDRQHPCSACSKRGEGSSCTFNATGNIANGTNGGVTKSSSSGTAESKKAEVQAKLQKLEDLVQQLIQSGAVIPKADSRDRAGSRGRVSTDKAASENPTSGEPAIVESTVDNEKEDSTKSSIYDLNPPVLMCYHEESGGYVGATHWAALLNQINCVKESLDARAEFDPSEPSSQITMSGASVTSSDDADLIIGSSSGGLTLEDAVQALPPRHITDRLLSIYYSHKFSHAVFIHTTKFRREYETFLRDPTSQNLIWISVLYSILCLGSMVATRVGKIVALDSRNVEPTQLLKKARQCLVAGEHTKAQPYVIEALVIYQYCKYQLCTESDSTLWALTGYVTRLAQRLGYHRDPKHLKRFTPFEAEMRRRTWYWVATFDMIFSFQYGMPAIIHDEQCDTEAPGNHEDEDFDEDTVVMPPPRVSTEFTNMLFYSHKIRMMSVFRKVIQHALSLTPPAYEAIMALDAELKDLNGNIPPVLRMRGSIREFSFSDSPYMILHRMVLELSYHKCLCVLHRTFLTHEKDNPEFEPSREQCRESAMRILEMQSDAYDECQPGGRLWDERWMISSLTLHDFLLASMILCMDLSERKTLDLQKCYKIWSEKKHLSRDARHASNVLGAMLARLLPDQFRRGNTPQPIEKQIVSTDSMLSNGFTTLSNPAGESNTTFANSTFTPPSNFTSNLFTADGNGPNTFSTLPGMAGLGPYQRGEEAATLPYDGGIEDTTMDELPAIDSFEPLDFDTLMNDGGSIDWGLVDRYLFDSTKLAAMAPAVGSPNTTLDALINTTPESDETDPLLVPSSGTSSSMASAEDTSVINGDSSNLGRVC
ncbi:hypothetical protein Dda_2264 [Drechslerella dactyloides]|uniref:Zn(2)-C6 fungal-type domain-containing protein n=1 Tax=Drechslerella dactyloides TaxID=74499 RepID=A0AAD6NMV1_DREDA|nr:hypothetical protein Dda_2264 [Drechslerella dactyloides]